MIKEVDIQIEQNSWLPSLVPVELQNLANISRQTNVFIGLLHTALWTRPPQSFGFSLADCWAWLRYGPAISTSNSYLSLRTEWGEIDCHQKTVLSDEMGVGFTTQLFAEELNFILYADTKYVVKVVPSLLSIGQTKKQGPDKSPDYIAIDNSLQISVLECKGSQKSIESLTDAISRGIEQKNNLIPSPSVSLKHTLVAGLFIPQSGNFERPLIYIRDPEPDQIINELLTADHRRLLIGVTQIGLAKHFALMGLYSIADALSSTEISDESTKLKNVNPRERERLLRGDDKQYLSFVQESPLPPAIFHKREDKPATVKFQMQCPVELYDRLISSDNVAKEIEEIIKTLLNASWATKEEEYYAELHSPLGFTLKLGYEF